MNQEDQEDSFEYRPPRLLEFMLFLFVITGLAFIIVPNWIRARSPGNGSSCRSNLKNIGSALEMYSSDWSGEYPGSLAHLTPNYLKTIPVCPAALKVTYEFETGVGAAYNTKGFEDYYFIKCAGTYHNSVSVPTNYPQYDAIQGLIDR